MKRRPACAPFGLLKTVSLGLEDVPVGLVSSFGLDELPPGGSTTLTRRDSPLLARGRPVVWLTGGLAMAVQRTPLVVFVDKPGYELATNTRRLAVQAGDSAILAVDVIATDWTQAVTLSLIGAGGIPAGSADLALASGGPFADPLEVVPPPARLSAGEHWRDDPRGRPAGGPRGQRQRSWAQSWTLRKCRRLRTGQSFRSPPLNWGRRSRDSSWAGGRQDRPNAVMFHENQDRRVVFRFQKLEPRWSRETSK
jgi:hypothetical protein